MDRIRSRASVDMLALVEFSSSGDDVPEESHSGSSYVPVRIFSFVMSSSSSSNGRVPVRSA